MTYCTTCGVLNCGKEKRCWRCGSRILSKTFTPKKRRNRISKKMLKAILAVLVICDILLAMKVVQIFNAPQNNGQEITGEAVETQETVEEVTVETATVENAEQAVESAE